MAADQVSTNDNALNVYANTDPSSPRQSSPGLASYLGFLLSSLRVSGASRPQPQASSLLEAWQGVTQLLTLMYKGGGCYGLRVVRRAELPRAGVLLVDHTSLLQTRNPWQAEWDHHGWPGRWRGSPYAPGNL